MEFPELKKLNIRKNGVPAKKKMYEMSQQGYTYEDIAYCFDVTSTYVRISINAYIKELDYERKRIGKIWEKIDMGKVFALRRAGWPDSKIAKEFRLEPEEMTNIITTWQQDTGLEEMEPCY